MNTSVHLYLTFLSSQISVQLHQKGEYCPSEMRPLTKLVFEMEQKLTVFYPAEKIRYFIVDDLRTKIL